MKIAVISPGLYSVPPVIGTSVEHVIHHVAEQLERNNQVIVYTKKCRQFPESTLEGNLHYKRFRFYSPDVYLQQVIKHIQEEKPSVIIIENRPSYVTQIKHACPKIPIVLNMHSDVFSLPPNIRKEEMTEVSRNVDALITNSKALENFFADKYPAFKGKSYGIHLGIDTTPYETARMDLENISRWREKYRLSSEDPTLLFAGRVMEKKGVHLILEVMPALIEKIPRLKLLITGSPKYGNNKDTSYMKKIRTMAKQINNHVVFTNFVKPIDMPYIYQLADIVVTPSIWNEPFLLVNLEAMASTKPVVTTNNGGIPEVVKHGETGIILTIDNPKEELFHSILSLLESNSLSERLSKNGFERAKEFSWERTAGQYLQVFKKVTTL
ncbi:glycosyltransferase family 4 protein [Bacillus sp. DTU_2020_1000418_1_SI_GHA_SEK_038]|uniref:glycosyltransferase family 4 protein n=1 Tax=Bacillus sp. DTU_2020_1000418_1_SI_GHA_SEK_038 TaxID=3077585 RepID=UPI0028F0AAE6|nr:glycosyltransferase family 4 protein [Bacillus sp. DTU_2020_1000418_1_SI_GHA_SEK_038]WNS75978.1 glycosyltransferase family 4 protein [Bacillus sp. DTU_2020_1000418_1_SI_GHA_SEK_038]